MLHSTKRSSGHMMMLSPIRSGIDQSIFLQVSDDEKERIPWQELFFRHLAGLQEESLGTAQYQDAER